MALTVACGGGNASSAPGANGASSVDPSTGLAGGSAVAASGSPDAGATTTTTSGLDSSDGGTKLPNVGATRGPDPGRSRDDIKGIILAHRDQARACYDASLTAHPGIEGDVDVKWTINPSGDVSDISVDSDHSTIMEPSVGQCLMTLIMGLKFSASPRGLETHAHYPFNFHPRGAALPGSVPAGSAAAPSGTSH